MRILRATDHRRMPWKNGGGETLEIASSPEGSGIDAFRWRVSMARVASSGPFSLFPDVDRTLAVLDGQGLELLVAGAPPAMLTPQSPPHRFPGDRPTEARLLGGPVTDLNVMTRRGAASHTLRRLELSRGQKADLSGVRLVVMAEGEGMLGSYRLGARDAVLLEDFAAAFEADGDAVLFLVEIG